jgi:hypothetical protein
VADYKGSTKSPSDRLTLNGIEGKPYFKVSIYKFDPTAPFKLVIADGRAYVPVGEGADCFLVKQMIQLVHHNNDNWADTSLAAKLTEALVARFCIPNLESRVVNVMSQASLLIGVNQMKRLRDDVGDVQQVVNRIAADVDTHKTAIARVDKAIDSNKTAIDATKADVDTHKTAVARFDKAIDSNKTAIDATKAAINLNNTAIMKAIDSNKTGIDANKAAIDLNNTVVMKKIARVEQQLALTQSQSGYDPLYYYSLESRTINGQMRKGSMESQVVHWAADMVRELDTQPPSPGGCYRGMADLPWEILNTLFTIGSIYSDKGFMSASLSQAVA